MKIEDFRIIYRILKYLRDSMDSKDFNWESFTGKNFDTNESRFAALLDMLDDANLIRLSFTSRPCITLPGLEYFVKM